jgi:hypothetical protein
VSRGIDRRAFVKGAALGLAAPGLLSALSGCGPSEDLEAQLAGFHRDPSAAEAIGRAYLQIAADEQDRDTLVEALAGPDLDEWERLARHDAAALEHAVRTRHREDFLHARTIRLHGWILSLTEARLATLTLL